MFLDTTVRWNEEWANHPEFEINIKQEDRTRPFHNEEFKYRAFPVDTNHKGDQRVMYIAVGDVWGDFLFHDPGNEAGYGGHTFPLTLESGGEIKIKGPWSSRAACANEFLGANEHLVDVVVVVTDDSGKFPSRRSAVIKLSALKELLPDDIGIRIARHKEDTEYSYEPYDKNDKSRKSDSAYEYEYPFS